MTFTRMVRSIGFPAVLLAGAILLSGCAETIQYPHFPDQSKRVENPGFARIYVMRPPAVFGCGVAIRYGTTKPAGMGPRMGDGFRMIGEIGPGGYLCWEEPPFTTRVQKTSNDRHSFYELTTESNRVYYLKAYPKSGWINQWSVVELLSEEQGQKLLKKCKPARAYQHRNQNEN